MTDLKPFQRATVQAVLAAFDRRRKTRRFLVADEVGLGKTVVAQHVIREMMAKNDKGTPFVVFYMCSNLTIARQNRRKLLEVVPAEEREAADCPVDRLSLLRASEPPQHPRLHLYSLTPDTSIPMRKRHRRDGRKEERALIHTLVERLWPRLLDEWGENVFQGSATVHWEDTVEQQRNKASNTSLRSAFLRSVRQEFQLGEGRHFLAELRARWESGELAPLDLIVHLRNSLAASAVEEVSPDLVIFDEFQKFNDLLKKQEDEAAERVVGRLLGHGLQRPPALLLLSATPYRLFTRRWEEEAGASHRSEFFELIEVLFGGDGNGSDVTAAKKRKECEDAFVQLEAELRKGQPDSEESHQSRRAIEDLLCPIIARTERASHEDGWDEFRTGSLTAPIASEDLSVFKHLSTCLDDAHRHTAVPYWTSIPLPMQTMGNHYVAWKTARPTDGNGVPRLNVEMRDAYSSLKSWPHPRLRALAQLAPTDQLNVPWLSPTAPWWSPRGVWKNQTQSLRKLLVFSRFRAVPQAIAAAFSYDLEARTLANDGLPYAEVSRRRLLSATDKRHPLLGLFHPSPFLVQATDPLAAGTDSLPAIRRSIYRQLEQAIQGLGIAIREEGPSLPPWRLIARLEHSAGNWDWISQAWWWVHGETATGQSEDSGLANLLNDWDEEAAKPLHVIRPAGIESLVDYALGSPGVVIGRALLRHWPQATSDSRDRTGKPKFRHTLASAWMGLRNYLDQRWFYRLLCKENESYPEAIIRAVVDGNLESVLDEHLWITARLRTLQDEELAVELREGLTVKSGMFFLHPLEEERNATFSLRCHVALPFIQTQIRNLEDGAKPFRTDEMRRAFNTPFWPHVLSTTSVGQEGLDFHAWCDTLVHWDLCRNPVDLEQREGRIQRFGGLPIRRAIASRVGEQAMATRKRWQSPWARIEELANEKMSDESGLAPWWVCKEGSVSRYVFDVPTSEQQHWLQWMKEQRLLYRLALGQPNQEDLLEVLASKSAASTDDVRDAVINLSPWFRDR
ncbi:MAG: helicase-related protein [Candidatus Paceibacterota bacterium]